MTSTYLTSRQMILKTGWSVDQQQRTIQKLMLYGFPLTLLFSGWYFPIGVIIYWVTQNIFSYCQQYWVLHKYPPPVTAGNIPLKQAKTPTVSKAITTSANGSKPAPATKARLAGGGFVNPVQDEPKSGMFRRKREPEPEPTPAVDTRAAAPKPGAKPVNPKTTPRKAPPRKVVTSKAAPTKKSGPKR
jgi:YidC/Oxa1 family membrane protein insertase